MSKERNRALSLCTVYRFPEDRCSRVKRSMRGLQRFFRFRRTRASVRTNVNGLITINGITPFECDRCSICLERVQGGKKMALLACRHTFHWMCIQSWLSTKDTCPMCNAYLQSSTSCISASNRKFLARQAAEDTPNTSSRTYFDEMYTSSDRDLYFNEEAAREAAIAFMAALAEADMANNSPSEPEEIGHYAGASTR